MAVPKQFIDAAKFIGLASAVFVAGFVVATALHATLEDSSTKTTWIGAIFTAAAFCNAVYSFTDQRRTKMDQEMALAKIAASGLRWRVKVCHRTLSLVKDWLDTEYPVYNKRIEFDNMRGLVDGIDIWAAEDLVPLIPLRDNCAVHLSEIATTCTVIKRLMNPHIGNEVEFIVRYSAIREMVRELLTPMMDNVVSCVEELDRAAAVPPIARLTD